MFLWVLVWDIELRLIFDEKQKELPQLTKWSEEVSNSGNNSNNISKTLALPKEFVPELLDLKPEKKYRKEARKAKEKQSVTKKQKGNSNQKERRKEEGRRRRSWRGMPEKKPNPLDLTKITHLMLKLSREKFALMIN